MNAVLFRDLLMNMLLGLTALVVLVMFNINPKAADTASIDSPGNMIVSIAWPEGPYDIDLWVRAPGEEKAVGYSNRGSDTFNLLRDDLGTMSDDGPFNREDAYSRGLPAGEYIINVHGYAVSKELPVSVEIRLAAGGGNAHLIVQEQITIRQAQERTVVRFRLDADGRVVPGSMNRVYVPLRSAKK